MIGALLKKYGQSMEICDAQGETLHTVKGFVQPLAFSDTDALWELTPGGGVRQEKYLLIAPADAFDGDGAERGVVFQGRRYTVLRADKFDALAGVSHWEAVLRLEGRVQA